MHYLIASVLLPDYISFTLLLLLSKTRSESASAELVLHLGVLKGGAC